MKYLIMPILLIVSASAITGCDNHIKYVEEHPSYEGYSYELEFNKDDGKNLKVLHKTFLNNKYVETNILQFTDCAYFNKSNWKCGASYEMVDGDIFVTILENNGNRTSLKLSKSFFFFD
jgi:hypothetical protein